MKQSIKNIDWCIHLVANGVECDCCGETEAWFPDYTCNAHTHGMNRYDHPDFQLVLQLPQADICYILNTLGFRVQAGERFKAGDLVNGIFLDCPVRLDEFEESGRTVLRVIIPDSHNIFPEDARCASPYRLQLLPTDSLYRKEGMLS